MIPSSSRYGQQTIAHFMEDDPLLQEYRAFFALFDWQLVETFEAQHAGRGRPGHPVSAYLKACLLRIQTKLSTASELRHFLVSHALLLIEFGFRLVLDPTQPFGFDVKRTVPCVFWWRKQLQRLDRDLLQSLLHATVQALVREIPGLGETVAYDVKHIYAWVRENNPRVYTKGRFDITHHPTGDPDCLIEGEKEYQSGPSRRLHQGQERKLVRLWLRCRGSYQPHLWRCDLFSSLVSPNRAGLRCLSDQYYR